MVPLRRLGRREIAPESEAPPGAGDGDVVELVGGADLRLQSLLLLLRGVVDQLTERRRWWCR